MRTLNRALSIFTAALPMVLFCLCGGSVALYTAAAVAVHECAHLIAIRALGGRICGFRAAPFGLCIDYDENSLSLGGEILAVAAGSAANIITALLLFRWLPLFSAVSILLALMNLLPVAPLDGARLLGLLLSLVCEPASASRISYFVSYICGFLCFLVASYLLITSVVGIYPLLFSIYIFCVNARFFESDEKV